MFTQVEKLIKDMQNLSQEHLNTSLAFEKKKNPHQDNSMQQGKIETIIDKQNL